MYLASWGMYRGSSELLQKSYKIFDPIVHIILTNKTLWDIDISDYSEEICKEIIDFSKIIKNALIKALDDKSVSDTLLTKILMGTMRITPAFDTYLKNGIIISGINEFRRGKKTFSTGFSLETLLKIKRYYGDNKEEIDEKIISLLPNKKIKYKTAKKIDMIFWQYGYENNEYIKKTKKEQKLIGGNK